MNSSDILIVGGGIVGLATAFTLTQQVNGHIILLEKEATLAAHQSGRNSGVLHSGIYYKPGSLKARNCRAGKALMEAFCAAHDIPYRLCGKVIVATRESEFAALQDIYARGQANGVTCELIDKARLDEIEPHTAGLRAIHVPEAGIVDYRAVCHKLAELLEAQGHTIVMDSRVLSIEERPDQVTAVTTRGTFSGGYLINCAGLHSDRVARLTGQQTEAQIVPFRGEYYELKPEARYLCNSLIYPVPDPKFPFLGVHFTLTIDGSVTCGPNAVLAFAREGYRLTDVNARDLWETLSYSGFRRLASRYWKTGMGEMWRSASKSAFVKALQQLVPAIRADDLVDYPAGIRAQALLPDGSMMDDFAFAESARIVNVVNAPSPAATSSLAIGRAVAAQLYARLTA